jgi:TM2 domain-containing membrane protein YozV
MKNKNVAGILALLFGSFGIHRFYLGQVGLGILYIVFFFISFFISLIDAIVFFSQDQDTFDLKYNKSYFKVVRKERPDYHRQYQSNRQPGSRPSTISKPAGRPPQRRKVRPNPYKSSGVEKYKEYDYTGAIEDFKKALEINEKDIATHFNIACAYSLTENTERAFYHLDRAVDLGFNDFAKIREHDAFAYLRIQDEFADFAKNGFQLNPITRSSLQENQTADKLQLPNDLLDQLNKLNELKNKGLLTEEEFVVQKEKLMK